MFVRAAPSSILDGTDFPRSDNLSTQLALCAALSPTRPEDHSHPEPLLPLPRAFKMFSTPRKKIQLLQPSYRR